MRTKQKGLNIDLTRGQYQMLHTLCVMPTTEVMTRGQELTPKHLTIYLMQFVTQSRPTYENNTKRKNDYRTYGRSH